MDYENIQMTRISDLPDGGVPSMSNGHPPPSSSSSSSSMFPGGFNNENSNMYIPLNVHPSPYGIAPPTPGGMLPPQQDQDTRPSSSYPGSGRIPDDYPHSFHSPPPPPSYTPTEPCNLSVEMIPPSESSMLPKITANNVLPEFRLPSRDITKEITDFTNDEEIQPNYIPKRNAVKDYVQEHEEVVKETMQNYKKEKEKEEMRETWFHSLSRPIMLTVIYFIFSLPIINTILFRRLAFLQIYREDGNFNLGGLMLKAVGFGCIYWLIEQSMLSLENLADSI